MAAGRRQASGSWVLSAASTEAAIASAQPVAGLPLRRYSLTAEARSWRLLALLGVTAVVWLVSNQLTDGVFITPRNLTNLSVQLSMTALVAMGLTALLIAREIDLSVGALFALVTVLSVTLQVKLRWSAAEAVAVSVVLGLLTGLFQGLIVTRLQIPSFIVTLAAFSYLQGAAYVISGSETLSGTRKEFLLIANGRVPQDVTLWIGVGAGAVLAWVIVRRLGLRLHPFAPPSLRRIRPLHALSVLGLVLAIVTWTWTFTSYRGLPIPVVIVFVVAAIWLWVATQTAYGRHVYAIGGNLEAARRAGIRVGPTVLGLFVFTGLLAAVAGLIEASRLDSGPPSVGLFLALDGISAAVVGGASLFGGQGGVVGTLIGTLLLASIQNGLSLRGVSTDFQDIASGLILLAVVVVDSLARRHAARG